MKDYSLYRPSYPAEAVDYVFNKLPVNADTVIADIGAGTGLFTELLLANNSPVIAVEPNAAMRAEADDRLRHYPNYNSVSGSAEETRLDDKSIDIIVAAQSFHWFNLPEAKREFARILKLGGKTVLIWNRRDSSGSEFLMEYETLLGSMIAEYSKVSHDRASDAVIEEFLGSEMVKAEFSNYQDFDFRGFKGRLQSSSYCPIEGAEGYVELMVSMEELFQTHAVKKLFALNIEHRFIMFKVNDGLNVYGNISKSRWVLIICPLKNALFCMGSGE